MKARLPWTLVCTLMQSARDLKQELHRRYWDNACVTAQSCSRLKLRRSGIAAPCTSVQASHLPHSKSFTLSLSKTVSCTQAFHFNHYLVRCGLRYLLVNIFGGSQVPLKLIFSTSFPLEKLKSGCFLPLWHSKYWSKILFFFSNWFWHLLTLTWLLFQKLFMRGYHETSKFRVLNKENRVWVENTCWLLALLISVTPGFSPWNGCYSNKKR